MWSLLAVTTVAGCRTPPALRNCGDDLSGQWALPGESGRWTLRDSAAHIEGFPLSPDQRAGADGVIAAPRWLELVREQDVLAGRMHRRHMRREQRCEAAANLRIVACHGQTLDVERSALPTPTSMQPCAWSPSPSNVQEQWQRVSQ
ncbi:MAG: hypothetical protein KBG15_19595 [Kofleriaceae bacterium]|nr:hypothetical protein [Kofleriaceae bacterium]